MTFEEAKDQVGKKYGFESNIWPTGEALDEVVELYATAKAAQAWDEACVAYQDLLFLQDLERPLNNPTNPYPPKQEKP